MTTTTIAPTAGARRFADGVERVAWTLLEGSTAIGLVAGYQALPVTDIPDGWLPLVVPVVTAGLAAVKSYLAQKFGNGTAATLPEDLEPVPQESIATLGGDTADEDPEALG